VNRRRGNRAARRGGDSQLWCVRDVACRVDISDRGMLVIIDDESSDLVSLAAELRTQII